MESNTINRFHYDESPCQRRSKKSCNSHICFAYMLSVIASIFIVGGVYLSYNNWDKIWLILSVLGIILILFGSCFYYSGSIELNEANNEQIFENRPRRRRRYRNRGLSTDQLMPSAPPLSQSRSVSQFSLNMIPQYFSSNESEAISLNTNSSPNSPLKTFSQIFSVNGQSYLILPLSGEPINGSNSVPLQSLVLKVTDDKVQNSNSGTCDETSCESNSKKTNREEQSCQTDDYPEQSKRSKSSYRDVQLQTLDRTHIDQTESDNIHTDGSPINVTPDYSSSSNSSELIPIAGPSNVQFDDFDVYGMTSYESNCTSLNTQSEVLESDNLNNISLIDFNDENNTGIASQIDSIQSRTQTECSTHVLNQTLTADPSIDESNGFDHFSIDNINEEEVDQNLSTPPPTYQEVFDDNEETIVVNYGTL